MWDWIWLPYTINSPTVPWLLGKLQVYCPKNQLIKIWNWWHTVLCCLKIIKLDVCGSLILLNSFIYDWLNSASSLVSVFQSYMVYCHRACGCIPQVLFCKQPWYAIHSWDTGVHYSLFTCITLMAISTKVTSCYYGNEWEIVAGLFVILQVSCLFMQN